MRTPLSILMKHIFVATLLSFIINQSIYAQQKFILVSSGKNFHTKEEALKAYIDQEQFAEIDKASEKSGGSKKKHVCRLVEPPQISLDELYYSVEVRETSTFEDGEVKVWTGVEPYVIKIIGKSDPVTDSDPSVKPGSVTTIETNDPPGNTGWKLLPECGAEKKEQMKLGTGGSIEYKSVRCSKLPDDKQIKLLVANVNGLTEAQAGFLLFMAKEKKTSIVFGGSKVRGNATDSSDLDIGFDLKDQKEVYAIADKYNKKFYGSSLAKGPGAIRDKFIFTGKSTATIPLILSPEEFFMRSGNRFIQDKGGAPYVPSGFIAIDGLGNVHLGKP